MILAAALLISVLTTETFPYSCSTVQGRRLKEDFHGQVEQQVVLVGVFCFSFGALILLTQR